MNLITELVIANRILANEDVVDAYGHVSVRNPEAPERFFLAHSRSPALVEAGDIVEHTLEAQPLKRFQERDSPYRHPEHRINVLPNRGNERLVLPLSNLAMYSD